MEDQELESQFRHILTTLDGGRWLDDEARKNTPRRWVHMMRELTTPTDFKFTTFAAESSDMITLAPIPFYTMCEHHTAPFFGNVFISYVPRESIAGLSKFPRLVNNIVKGFWTQESLTKTIADELDHYLYPLGVGVVVRAEHLCMAMRGVRQANVITTTSAMRGVYSDHNRTAKAEFLQLVHASL